MCNHDLEHSCINMSLMISKKGAEKTYIFATKLQLPVLKNEAN